MAKEKTVVKKKKTSVKINEYGRVVINCTYNNTLVSISNSEGDVVSWATSGSIGFKGAKKSTPYAATLCAEDVAKKAMEKGIQVVDVITKGAGNSKIPAIKGIKQAGLKVKSINDRTPIPHNGCRARKRRRN